MPARSNSLISRAIPDCPANAFEAALFGCAKLQHPVENVHVNQHHITNFQAQPQSVSLYTSELFSCLQENVAESSLTRHK